MLNGTYTRQDEIRTVGQHSTAARVALTYLKLRPVKIVAIGKFECCALATYSDVYDRGDTLLSLDVESIE